MPGVRARGLGRVALSPRLTSPETAYTIGHSTRSAAEVVALLGEVDVRLVADVRAFPSSRRYPQFNRGALAAWLGEAGVRYLHMPALGGRRTPAPDSPNGGWR